MGTEGSSPLARGLPLRLWLRRPPPGIIPARAGFTAGRLLVVARHADHPRSRGVYAPSMVDVDVAAGSSPLARGLQRPLRLRADLIWIIPARAGFTKYEKNVLLDT